MLMVWMFAVKEIIMCGGNAGERAHFILCYLVSFLIVRRVIGLSVVCFWFVYDRRAGHVMCFQFSVRNARVRSQLNVGEQKFAYTPIGMVCVSDVNTRYRR